MVQQSRRVDLSKSQGPPDHSNMYQHMYTGQQQAPYSGLHQERVVVPPKCVCRRQPYPGPGGGHQSLFHLSSNANVGAATAPKDNGFNQTNN